MKNKILISTITSIISFQVSADYMAVVQLEPQGIIMEETPINGELRFSPSSINRGESSTLSWNYDYANKVNVMGIGSYGRVGSLVLSPLASKNYQVEITKGSQKAIQDVFLTVIQPNSNVSFSSEKSRIGKGQSTQLNWDVSNAYSIDIDNSIGNGLDVVGSYTISPTTDTTYTLSGFGFNGDPLISSVFIDVVENSIVNSFNSSASNVTKGGNITFNWDVTDSEGLNLSPYGVVTGKPTGSKNVTFPNAGNFDFTLESTSLNGTVVSSNPININVYNPSVINSYTVNGSNTTIDASPNQSLTFGWNASDAISYKFNGENVNGNSKIVVANATTGTTDYELKAFNGADDFVSKSLSVNVVGLPVIDSFNAPTYVFANSPFNLSWTGTGVSKYEIKSNSDNSGIDVSPFNLGTALTKTATPTVAGTYTYTLSGYNTANSKIDSIKNVVVESSPTFTDFTVNGETSITVAPSATLTYASSGLSAGSTFAGRNSENNANETNPATAPTSAGTYTYYGAATKTLNSITEYSALKSVSVTVIAAPAFGTVSAPTNVFASSAFTMSWTGTNVVNYKIKSNNAASGISTTDVDLGTVLNRSITPTAAGTYTYTITATNSVGVSKTATKEVVVEVAPTFTVFTVNGATSITVAPSATLTYASSGFTSGSSFVARNSANTANATNPATAPTSAGTYTYYGAATKTLNGVSLYSGLKSVSVTVAAGPTIGTVTSPTNVFTGYGYTMSWSGSNVVNYKIKSNNAASGIATTDVDLGTAVSRAITPTAAGTFTYTITATNSVGVSTTTTKQVIVEAAPTFTSFTVNGATSITVAPSATLTYASSGFTSGSSFVARNSANTAAATNPATAPASAGTYTYYGAATKTLNGVSLYSGLKSVSVTVASNPLLGTITAPTNVFSGYAYTMSWSGTNVVNYKIKSNNAASGIAITDVDLGTSVSRAITPTAPGTFTYTITATNSVGVSTTTTKQVIVEAAPTFTSFTVNGATSISVAPSATLSYASSGFTTGSSFVARNSANTAAATNPATAPTSAGTYVYYGAATKTLNGVSLYSGLRSVSVTVAAGPTIGTITAPTNVFSGYAYTMSWSGTNVVNYKIKSNNAASGIATTDVDLGTAVSRAITPTAAGTYTYTITATNSVGVSTTTTKQVIVEAAPIFTSFTVNGTTSITVAPSAALSYASSGFTSGSSFVARNSANTANATNPTTAPASAGTYTYYGAATKTLNGVSLYSGLKSVSVTVAAGPTIGTVSAPTNVFVGYGYTMSWSGSNVVNYKIKSNNAASGIATTDVDLGTAVSRAITPTAAGTYTYTITATNSVGVSITTTKQVIVEAAPTFTAFTVNGATSITVAPNATLTYASGGFTTGSSFVARNSANTAAATNPAKAPASGTYTYYGAATKTLNGVSLYSGLKSVKVIVEDWIPTTSTYSVWVNSGTYYGCTNWSPLANTINSGTPFVQTASDCKLNQTQNRQDRVIEKTTGVIRNKGTVVVVTQTLMNQTTTQNSIGTKPVGPICYSNNASNNWKLVLANGCPGAFSLSYSATINGVLYKDILSETRASPNLAQCRSLLGALTSVKNKGLDSVSIGGKNVKLVEGGQLCY